ncbi:MAG: tRNA 2-thiouridine(34) synthase MnmA [Patescibacteria group bacterium]
MKKKVIVAMSGGVDSSVAAALLKNNGYDVVGVFMKFWKETNRKNENRCCSIEAKRDVQRVAIKLGIPFYVIDARKEFKKRVVDYFIKEYKKGNTPNPCVECNRWIKFRFLIEKALQSKADYVATGHYARVSKKFVNSKLIRYSLMTARDKQKDQSYFLWTLNQKQLKKILFPIGDYTKEQVRGMAKKWGLPVFEKKDSQEICFINADLRRFLESRIHAEKGPIITVEGKKVGEHEGLIFYTIGQRKGLPATPASWLAWRAGNQVYVVRKDLKKNALIVSKSEKDLLQKEMLVKNVNWLRLDPFAGRNSFRCKVKIRSTAPMFSATIKENKIIFNKKQRAITPGQSVVFYLKNEVLGGGIIH